MRKFPEQSKGELREARSWRGITTNVWLGSWGDRRRKELEGWWAGLWFSCTHFDRPVRPVCRKLGVWVLQLADPFRTGDRNLRVITNWMVLRTPRQGEIPQGEFCKEEHKSKRTISQEELGQLTDSSKLPIKEKEVSWKARGKRVSKKEEVMKYVRYCWEVELMQIDLSVFLRMHKIHGIEVLLVLCRKCQNQLAGNLILSLLFPNAETRNIRISSLSRWELGGDVGETRWKHEPQNALSAFQWICLYTRWHQICLGHWQCIGWINTAKFKNLRNSCLSRSWEFSWLFPKAREESRENQHSERWTKAHGTLLVSHVAAPSPLRIPLLWFRPFPNSERIADKALKLKTDTLD